MSEPTNKSQEINTFLSSVMGRDREETITQNQCMSCGGRAMAFRDALSVREYTISGLCQRCQDSVFGGGE